ncbi:NADH-ubiquinone oxidoreductase chain 4L [Glycine max]|nr:NADH-ubiquinone oxidoreductase chain 4L [Glycine max]
MGESFASLVSTVAAEESAIGLVIFVITFRVRGTIAVDSFNRELQKVTQGHSLLHSSKNIIKT